MIHGPDDLGELKERAKATLMQHLVRLAEQQDAVPPTMRAKYVQKLNEAMQYKATGVAAELLAKEAELRGVTVEEQADLVISMSAPSDELELKRMQLNMSIDAAGDIGDISDVLASVGTAIELPDIPN